MIETNITAVVAMTKACVKGMLARNRGHIVNIGSVAGKEAYGGTAWAGWLLWWPCLLPC